MCPSDFEDRERPEVQHSRVVFLMRAFEELSINIPFHL
jgi:hypothetical protein